MNTVLPARAKPVTPRRIVGVPRWVAKSTTLSKAISASSVRLVSFIIADHNLRGRAKSDKYPLPSLISAQLSLSMSITANAPVGNL